MVEMYKEITPPHLVVLLFSGSKCESHVGLLLNTSTRRAPLTGLLLYLPYKDPTGHFGTVCGVQVSTCAVLHRFQEGFRLREQRSVSGVLYAVGSLTYDAAK